MGHCYFVPLLAALASPGSALASGWVWQPELYLGFALAAFLSKLCFSCGLGWDCTAQRRGVAWVLCPRAGGVGFAVNFPARVCESRGHGGFGRCTWNFLQPEQGRKGGEIAWVPSQTPHLRGLCPCCCLTQDSGLWGDGDVVHVPPLPMLLQFWGPFAAPVPCPRGDTAAAGGDTLPN